MTYIAWAAGGRDPDSTRIRRRRWRRVLISAAVLLAGFTVLLPAAPAAHAASAVCNIYCDVRDPALAVGDRQAATATAAGRVVTLNISDGDDMAWASIQSGQPTDQVWLDRSFNGGQTWTGGSQLGDTSIPSGDTGWRTMMYNVDDPSAYEVGVVRACDDAVTAGSVIACTPWLRSTVHAATPQAASITALMQYFNPSTGLWDSGVTWQDAQALTTLVDYMQLTGDSTYSYAIAMIYNDNDGAHFTDAYIDDTGWWGLAWLRAYQYTGNTAYLQTAEYDENFMSQYWTSTCGGGVWWSTAENAKNAIANELYLELNAALHNAAPGDTLYLSRAEQEWTWFSASGMINSSHLVNDGLNLSTCANNGAATFTYNQGVILTGLAQLSLATGNTALLTTANAIATAATTHLTTNGVLVDPCEPNGCANDGYSFKGIFVRDLGEFARTTGTTAYNSFLNNQASSILADDTDGDGQSGVHWAGPIADLVYPNQQSAADAFNAGTASGGTPPPPPPPSGPIVAGISSSLCVDDRSASSTDLNPIQIYTCNGTNAQNWTVASNGTLQVLGKCMDIEGAGTADGTLVDLYDCNGGSNQVWQPQSNGSLLNPNSGKCLDDPAFSTTSGTQLDIWDCNGGSNQKWTLP